MLRIYALAGAVSLFGLAAWAQEQNAPDEMAVSVSVEEADLEAAESIFSRNCRACHGNKAQGVASYPRLSDKTAEYIAEKLAIYRAGERVGPNSVLMIQNAEDLSDEDINNLAVYVTTAFE